jgi:brefeldin A-resistance guanine nucleotide exchange factor 1
MRENINKFNVAEKPLKMTKKLIDKEFFPKDPEILAAFLHENLKNLNLTNVGQLIGDIDEYAGVIRRNYIGQMNFKGLPLDEAMRVMLKKFMLPG